MGAKKRYFATLSLLILLVAPCRAQLFYKAPADSALREINEQNPLPSANNASESILKAYQKRIKKAPVYIQDSVFVQLTTDFEGRVAAILFKEAKSQANLEVLLNGLEKVKLGSQGVHEFSLVYPKIKVEAYPIWKMPEPPTSVQSGRGANGGEINLVYRRSSFVYLVQSRMLKLEPPPTAKKSMYAGYFNATVTVNAKGSAVMVAFDSLSTNPMANDFFTENLYTVKFPAGGNVDKRQVGYTFQFQDEYFGTEQLSYSQIDSNISLSANLLAVNIKENTFAPLVKEELDTAVNDNSDLLNYHVGHRKFALRSDTSSVIMGNFLVAIVYGGYGALYTQAAVLTPTYFSGNTNAVYPAALPNCLKSKDAEYAATCTSAELLKLFYASVKIPALLDYWPGRLSKQVILVNEQGEIERIQVTLGNYYTPFDLIVMYNLSRLPKFEPGTLNGKPAPTIYTIISVLY